MEPVAEGDSELGGVVVCGRVQIAATDSSVPSRSRRPTARCSQADLGVVVAFWCGIAESWNVRIGYCILGVCECRSLCM